MSLAHTGFDLVTKRTRKREFLEEMNLVLPWHLGVDADSGLVHTVTTTAANAHDITQAAAPLHGQEEVVFADSPLCHDSCPVS